MYVFPVRLDFIHGKLCSIYHTMRVLYILRVADCRQLMVTVVSDALC
jgi:hypothetical protein